MKQHEKSFMNRYYSKNSLTTFFIFLVLASIIFFSTSAIVVHTDTYDNDAKENSLPNVFNENHGNLIESKLTREAVLKFPLYQLPHNKNDWDVYKVNLRNEIIKKTGSVVNQNLPLNGRETGSLKMKGYTIK